MAQFDDLPNADETLGTYIARIRTKLKLSLVDVASASQAFAPDTRISATNLNQIERGANQRPARQRVQALARILGIPERVLLDLAGYTEAPTSFASGSGRIAQQVAYRTATLPENEQELVLQMVNAIQRKHAPTGDE